MTSRMVNASKITSINQSKELAPKEAPKIVKRQSMHKGQEESSSDLDLE